MDEKDWIILRLLTAMSKDATVKKPWEFYQFARATVFMTQKHGVMFTEIDQLLEERRRYES
jgi:hypothetical protein